MSRLFEDESGGRGRPGERDVIAGTGNGKSNLVERPGDEAHRRGIGINRDVREIADIGDLQLVGIAGHHEVAQGQGDGLAIGLLHGEGHADVAGHDVINVVASLGGVHVFIELQDDAGQVGRTADHLGHMRRMGVGHDMQSGVATGHGRAGFGDLDADNGSIIEQDSRLDGVGRPVLVGNRRAVAEPLILQRQETWIAHLNGEHGRVQLFDGHVGDILLDGQRTAHVTRRQGERDGTA